MQLPNGDQAIIDERKLTEYCLSPDHDEGKHKARLFQELLGITLNETAELTQALQKAARTGEAFPGKLDHYGQRYVVDFEMNGPRGKAMVRSAWIIGAGESIPRLVSCYIV